MHWTVVLTVFLTVGLQVQVSGGRDSFTQGYDGSKIQLSLATSLETHCNAGFETFSVGESVYIAIANFWDGKSQDMSANSPVHELVVRDGLLNVGPKLQHMPTKGAHGWDFFVGNHGSAFLVVPNYYGCGSARGPADADVCRSTAVYRWSDKSNKFKLVQTLATAGPGQTDHFTSGSHTFIIVGENFNDEITIWKDNSGSRTSKVVFEKTGALPCFGAGAMAVALVSGVNYIIAAAYHDPETLWKTKSPVYQEQPDGSFRQIQVLETHGCHDVDFFSVGDDKFLFLSEDRDASTPLITSAILKFDSARNEFGVMQRIKTDGAHAAEFFEIDGVAWLAVANFGDRLGKRYEALSSVWQYDHTLVAFVLVAEVTTHGATDWEYFSLPLDSGDVGHYLAVSNEGDISQQRWQTSHIYQIIDNSNTSGDDSRYETHDVEVEKRNEL
eukprot:m.79803 g.79803  ORF g.79803 m.79803 type:complete len:442 (-) comp25250_c0_seq1:298-1623(-)